MNSTQIVYPIFALVVLTYVVLFKLFLDRVLEMRARKINPQKLNTAAKVASGLVQVQASDNFKNLFEMPVLFYALCLAVLVTGSANQTLVAGAWGYVFLRVVHSGIHCTYNNVRHRFVAYFLSALLLFGLWCTFLMGMST